MAELILPLTRTLFLPIGCPSLGSVERVSGDLRDVRCGSSGGEAYCLGEADILIEYTAPLSPAGVGGAGGRPCSWQALLSFPFQLSGRGDLPRDSACRVELGELDWTMVASRAIELETAVRVSYDPPREEAAEMKTVQRKEKRESEGGWQMVSLKEDEQERPTVEIVDLSGNAEQEKIKQAVAEALNASALDASALAEKEAVTGPEAETAPPAENDDREPEPKKSPVPLPEPVPAPDQPYQAVAVEAELVEPEILPPEDAPSRPKRRFRGLPGLHVEAYDNDIDVTAFHISIKL